MEGPPQWEHIKGELSNAQYEEALVEEFRAVEAEALEKAAKDWPTMDLAIATALQPAPSNKPRAQPPSNVVTWLRQRAAAIRALKEK